MFGRKPFSAPTRVSLLMWKEESDKWNRRSSPCHDDKEIQPVPRVPEVTASTKDPQSDHFYNHLHSKEDVDERIEGLTEKKQRYEVLIRENKGKCHFWLLLAAGTMNHCWDGNKKITERDVC